LLRAARQRTDRRCVDMRRYPLNPCVPFPGPCAQALRSDARSRSRLSRK
jgi:hypothetical protein